MDDRIVELVCQSIDHAEPLITHVIVVLLLDIPLDLAEDIADGIVVEVMGEVLLHVWALHRILHVVMRL